MGQNIHYGNVLHYRNLSYIHQKCAHFKLKNGENKNMKEKNKGDWKIKSKS